MYRKKGIVAFYQGLYCSYLKVIPLTGFCFCINEKLKVIFNIT